MTNSKTKKPQLLRIKDRTDHLLEEIRIVLPGTQALLGFQLVGIFSPGFNTLSRELQNIHLVSLCLVTFTTILLIAPAAYDRIAEQNKNTEFFIKFSTRILITALISLSLAISGELYVMINYVAKSQLLATGAALSSFLISMALWFGYSFYKKE